jgi:release factor glutamine methyltransferase
MNKPEIKVRNAFQQTLSAISPLYAEPECTSIVELVFCNLLQCSKIQLYQRFATNLLISQQIRLAELIIELQKHRPIQYILGETEFYGLRLKVGPGILIPRPETEELVHWIQTDYQKCSFLRVLDIGTGSGCIAVALAKSLFSAIIDAFDVSEDALKFARENASLNNCDISFFRDDIFAEEKNVHGLYDIIVSNPPYVPDSDRYIMHPNVLDHEPKIALFVPDSDPLLFYDKILEYSLIAGKPGGKVYFEINERYGRKIHDLFKMKGFIEIAIRKDIHGKDRMASGSIPKKI